jgi:hypothetical protein
MHKPMIVSHEAYGPDDPVTIRKLVRREKRGNVPVISEGFEIRIGFPVKQQEYYPGMMIKFLSTYRVLG